MAAEDASLADVLAGPARIGDPTLLALLPLFLELVFERPGTRVLEAEVCAEEHLIRCPPVRFFRGLLHPRC